MRKTVQAAAVLMLSLSLGLHWTALQSVAWTSMFLERLQTAPVLDALRTTFDGKHPCQLCQVVREGKAAEQREPATPAPAMKSLVKLELFLSSVPPLLVCDAGRVRPLQIRNFGFSSRSDPPLQRPPRSV
jgi:hypothetical protein